MDGVRNGIDGVRSGTMICDLHNLAVVGTKIASVYDCI